MLIKRLEKLIVLYDDDYNELIKIFELENTFPSLNYLSIERMWDGAMPNPFRIRVQRVRPQCQVHLQIQGSDL